MSNYYERNAKEYIESTINCDMSFHYNKFLKYIPKNGKILDIGFGSGRDIKYFMEHDYEVEGIDIVPIFVQIGEQSGYRVSKLSVENMEYENEFDGIWACASLLHIKREKLVRTLVKCIKALKRNGVLYCSFKYGDRENIIEDRYFNYINEKIIDNISKKNNFKILEIYQSYDVRSERSSEVWINIIIQGDFNG